MKKIAIYQYLASSCVVSSATVRCYVFDAVWPLPDRGMLVTLIAGSTKWRHLLIVGDGWWSTTHQWILFVTGKPRCYTEDNRT